MYVRRYRNKLIENVSGVIATIGLAAFATQVSFLGWWAPPVLIALCLGVVVRYMNDMNYLDDIFSRSKFWAAVSIAALIVAMVVGCTWAASTPGHPSGARNSDAASARGWGRAWIP